MRSLKSLPSNSLRLSFSIFPSHLLGLFLLPEKNPMKPRGIELSIGRPIFNFFAALKIFFLAALVILFLNVTFTLYTNVSTRYYTYPHPPFLKITSSSTFSFSSSSFFSTSSSPSSASSSYDPHCNCLPPSCNSCSSPPTPIVKHSSTSRDQSSSSSSSNSNPPPSISSPPPLLTSSLNPIPSPLILSPPPIKLEKPSSSYSNSSLSSSPPPLSTNFNSKFDRLRGKRKRLVKGCDISRGEWIPDPSAPYYTNSTCWAIQEHQNCMKYGRPNLDFLKWRWKPDGCELPLLEPEEFMEFMRGKNLAFIGDSLARNQMQSLMCLLSRVEYPEEIWPPAENVTQIFYKNYNFTIWAFWSPFLISAEETTSSTKYNMWSLYLDEPDPLWQLQLAKFDHIVVNTGNWYNRPAHFYVKRKLIGCHYCLFKNTAFMSVHKAHRRAFRTALDAIVENKQGFKGVTVVRTVSPSHFEGGEWNKGGDCRRTAPFRRGGAKLTGMDLELYKDQLKEFWKAKWEGNEKGLEFRLLDTTQAMLLRPDGHPSRYGHWPHEKRVLYNDCVHWCLPGPVDMWNDLLFRVMSI